MKRRRPVAFQPDVIPGASQVIALTRRPRA
jgi:hypothetical protein